MGDVAKSPMTVEDYLFIQAMLTVEIVSTCSSSRKEEEGRLNDIANRLKDLGGDCSDARTAAILDMLARRIVSTT